MSICAPGVRSVPSPKSENFGIGREGEGGGDEAAFVADLDHDVAGAGGMRDGVRSRACPSPVPDAALAQRDRHDGERWRRRHERTESSSVPPGVSMPSSTAAGPSVVPGERYASPVSADDARAAEDRNGLPAPSSCEIPIPEPRDDEVLVRVHGASICGTDLHIYDWNEWAEKRIAPRAHDVRPRDGRHGRGRGRRGPPPAAGRVRRGRDPHRVRALRHVPDGPRAHLREPADPGRGHSRACSPSTS